jgi:hypothetical protein
MTGSAGGGSNPALNQFVGGAYSTNGDTRVNQYIDANQPSGASRPETPPAVPPAQSPATPVSQVALSSKILDIQFDRYGSKSLERFGTDHVVISIFIADQTEPIVFTAPLEKSSTRSVIQVANGPYVFSGYLDDNFPVETLGDFDLVKTTGSTSETAKLLFRAYAANLEVKVKGEGSLSPISPARVEALSLQKGVFGWSKNWSVIGTSGLERAFYVMDVVKVQKGKTLRPNRTNQPPEQIVMTLHGDTLGNDPNPQTVDVTQTQTPAQATLTHTEDVTGRRDFSVAIPDPQSTQTVQVQITAKPDRRAQMPQIQADSPTPEPAISNNPPTVNTTAPMAPPQPTAPGPSPMAPVRLAPVTPIKPPALKRPVAPTNPAVNLPGSSPVVSPMSSPMRPPTRPMTPARPPAPVPQVKTPTPLPAPRPAPMSPGSNTGSILRPQHRPMAPGSQTPAPAPAPAPAPTTPTAQNAELRPMHRPPGFTVPKPPPNNAPLQPGDGPYMAIKAINPKAKAGRELAIQGMCMSDTRSSRQVSEGKCKTLWNSITAEGAPAAEVLDSIKIPSDIHTYCPNYESVIELKWLDAAHTRFSENKTKKALVFMGLLSAVAWQEYAWGHPARPNRYGIFQLALDIGQNYDASTCQRINVSNHTQNIKCGAYVALYNLKQGNRISSSNLGNFAMSHYFGSLQSGRSEQIRIAGKVKAYCQALERTALL